MSSRDRILARLQEARIPFEEYRAIESRRRVVPVVGTALPALCDLFVKEAELVGCRVYRLVGSAAAFEVLWSIIGDDQSIMAWDAEHIPLENLDQELERRKIRKAAVNADNVRVGLTGASAALASTGSVVLFTGAGRHRLTSLLPDVHVVALKESQILPDLESWVEQSATAFRRPSNTVIITGPSKTADIAQELIKGAHGPRQVHILLMQG